MDELILRKRNYLSTKIVAQWNIDRTYHGTTQWEEPAENELTQKEAKLGFKRRQIWGSERR